MASVQNASVTAAPTSHPYTCNTCQVAYRNIDLQKGHMKSDWHRYNLKRRVASLPPISSEVFSEKVLQARAATAAEADKALFERDCELCEKTYYSENSFQNHLLSQKHKSRESELSRKGVATGEADEAGSVMSSTFSLGEPLPSEKASNVDSDAEDDFNQVVDGLQKTDLSERPSPVKRPSNPQPMSQKNDKQDEDAKSEATDTAAKSADIVAAGAQEEDQTWDLKSCLFCNYSSPTVPLNVHHMERFHGMFIPEKKYLVDLDGLLKQLEERVHKYHECLFCGKFKANAFAVQTHMRDKSHCKIPYTTEEEQLDIGDFYDFRSTYSNGPGSDDDNEGQQKTEEDGWETDSSVSSLDSADLTAVPAEMHDHQFSRLDKNPHHSRDDPRHHRQADGYHSHAHKHAHAVFYDEYELHLPNGKVASHRSMNRYFKQNLLHYPTEEERAERRAALKEAGEDGSDDDAADAEGRDERAHGRALVSRDQAGMAGVSREQKRIAQKDATRNRSLQMFNDRKTEWASSKALNNHKSYYYRYNGGG